MSPNKVHIIDLTKRYILGTLLISTCLEICFFPSLENFIGCVVAIYGWCLISKYVFTIENLSRMVLPTFVIFGYGICYCTLPLIVTFIEGKPITFNFEVPYVTFLNQFLSVTIICVAFLACKKIYKPWNLLNRFWNKCGYMTILSERQIWFIAILGSLALLSRVVVQGDSNSVNASYFDHIMYLFSSLSTVPICIYFKDLYGEVENLKSKRFVLIYIIFLAILGIATTRRALILNCVASIGFIYILIIFYKNKKPLNPKNSVFCIIAFWLITGPLADIATAMAMNRNVGETSDANTTFKSVMKTLSDREEMYVQRNMVLMISDNGGKNSYGWSEYYVDNIFLDRFCNLRVMDATIYNAQNAGYGSKNGMDYFTQYLINQIPSSITSLLNLHKKDVNGTVTDWMLQNNFYGDRRYESYGLKVGGDSGIGLYIFGYYYYIVAFFIYTLVFFFMASWVNVYGLGKFLIPIPILCNMMDYFMFFCNANGIITSLGIITRSSFDLMFSYCMILFLLRIFKI